MKVDMPYRLEYDREWLAVVKSTETQMKYKDNMWLPPHKLTDERYSSVQQSTKYV